MFTQVNDYIAERLVLKFSSDRHENLQSKLQYYKFLEIMFNVFINLHYSDVFYHFMLSNLYNFSIGIFTKLMEIHLFKWQLQNSKEKYVH